MTSSTAGGLKKPKILVQRHLSRVVVLFSSRKLDFGVLTTELLARLLREDEALRRELKSIFGVDYDMVFHWERQQPIGTSDIELYMRGKRVLKINLKTTTKRNIIPALRRLCRNLNEDELGALAFPLKMTKELEESIIIAVAILDKNLCKKTGIRDLYRQIIGEIEQKRLREKLIELSFIDLEQAAIIESIRLSMEAKELATAMKIAMDEAKLIAMEARDSAQEAKKIAEENRQMLEELGSKIDTIINLIKKSKQDS